MLIEIGYEMVFEQTSPVPMMLILYTHPSRQADLHKPDVLQTDPALPIEEFIDSFGNRCARLLAPPGTLRVWAESVVTDSGEPDRLLKYAQQAEVEDLPTAVLPYLLASRYCEVDELSELAWQLFGHTPQGWERVQAILDWVHQHVQFGYRFARPTKTACDVYKEKTGVCRDFQHLAITFCRCMNVPARYATGYLGDIGVPPSDTPMDFSAWFEVFLDGQWYTCDARHNRPRIGRILMATGRDAVDVALTTAFGPSTLKEFSVRTDEIPAVT